jgi:hypothetical protein
MAIAPDNYRELSGSIKKQIVSSYEIAMTAVVAKTNEDLAIPYSNKK